MAAIRAIEIQDAPPEYQALGFTKCAREDGEPNIIALFANSDDAREFRSNIVARPDDRISAAKSLLRAEYYGDVAATAESIEQELNTRIKDGEYGESLREWLMEHIHETIDGSARVIYTSQAIQCVLHSDNDGAYFEEYGADGAVEDGAINWSALAFAAFERDVIEQLETDGVDVNNPVPECGECGSTEQDERRLEIGDQWLCVSCREEQIEQEQAEQAEQEQTKEDDSDV